MVGTTHSAELFPAAYSSVFPKLEKAAEQAGGLVESLLGSRVQVHLISNRAKLPDSALAKILGKNYKVPLHELTDSIGVRVITYYAEEVDDVVKQLSAEFAIDRNKSIDRRQALGLRSFGYRSVHLIAKLRGFRASSPEYSELRGRWFEIQIRSILEHAWAEIEHEIVYKSGVQYPESVLRDFAALAGTLELVEKQFQNLREARGTLIDVYKKSYASRAEEKIKLDTARLLALMEVEWPENLSWRQAEQNGKPFPDKIENRCIAALDKVGLCKAMSIRRRFRSRPLKRALKRFAIASMLQQTKVSHLALILLLLAERNFRIFTVYFPYMADDPSIRHAVRTGPRARRRPNVKV